MIFLSFFMSIKTRIFSHFLAPQAPKIRFWGWFWSDFLNENHRKITGKSSENVRGFLENLEDSRQFPEILGNSRKFSEIPGNSRKFPGILGNSRKFSEILGGSSKNRPIPLLRSRPKVAFPLVLSVALEFRWFFRGRSSKFSGPKKSSQNGFSWSRSEINLSTKGTRKVEKRTWSRGRRKDILKHHSICVVFSAFRPRSPKVEGACSGGGWPRDTKQKTFIFYLGTLQPLETSARLSQETRTESWEAEMLRSWVAELLGSESARNSVQKENPSRYGENFFWGGPYSTVIKNDFFVIFHVDKNAHFFAFFGAAGAENQVLGMILKRFP